MKVLIISSLDIEKFPIWNSNKDSKWMPLNNTVSGAYWLQLEAQQDLENAGIEFQEGEVEIKPNEDTI